MNSKEDQRLWPAQDHSLKAKASRKRMRCPRNLQWLSAVPLRLGTAAGGTLAPCVRLNPNLITYIIIYHEISMLYYNNYGASKNN